MSEARKIMSFDWALKTVLRDKANFDVLEGFLSALLKQDVTILELLESESNRSEEGLKSNQVDVLVKTESDERIIIEVQYTLEPDFLKRLLYGVSKVVVENLDKGRPYADVRKVISVSLVHFDVGFRDSDYVYHGTTEFRGVHSNELMVRESMAQYSPKNRLELEREKQRVFPEYYIIPVKRFNDTVGDDLDEWIYAMKNSEVPETFHAKAIDRMREKLDVLQLPQDERRRYDNYLLRRASDEGVLRLKMEEGYDQGLKKGMDQGLKKGMEKGIEKGMEEGMVKGAIQKSLDIAVKLLAVMDDSEICKVTGLTLEDVQNLRKKERGSDGRAVWRGDGAVLL